ncbi:MAG: hypothetical protein LUD27_02790 [Clostridia bacterium]|nr:hypothetical protein [Clostridia bacterium]
MRVSEADWDSLDQAQIQQYLLNVRANRPNIQNSTDDELLKLMELMKDGKPTITAVMCFSKNPQAVYPQLCITAVLVAGTRRGETTDDGQRFLANKRIEMYCDRLEIINAGGLYGAVDIDDLERIHADTRNKTLISVLETMRVVESRYSGIPTIRRGMKELSLPEPIFTDRKGLFKVTLLNGRKKTESKADDWQSDLLEFCAVPRSRTEIAEHIGKTQYYVMSRFVEPLVEQGLLAYTIPEKHKSPICRRFIRRQLNLKNE